MSGYPSECLRGISDKNQCLKNGLGSFTLFNNFSVAKRTDGFDELSVTWNDSDEAVQVIFSQRKDSGELQFKIGLAVLPRSVLDDAKHLPHFKGIMNYERKSTENNPYHGNILFRSGADKQVRNMLASFLAAKTRIILRDGLSEKIVWSSSDINKLVDSDSWVVRATVKK